MGIVKTYRRFKKSDIEKIKQTNTQLEINEIFKSNIEFFDIDKTWEIIHYLITGHKAYFGEHIFSIVLSPENQTFNISDEEHDFYFDNCASKSPSIIKKCEEIEIKMGMQFSYLTDTDINQILEVMESTDMDSLIINTNFEELNVKQIYPENWTNSIEQKEYVKFHYQRLHDFLKRAQQDNNYVIVEDN